MLVVKKLNDGVSIRKIAEEFGCGKTQIANIRENIESVKRQWEAGVPSENKALKRQKTDFEEINFKLFEWFSEARSKNLPILILSLEERTVKRRGQFGHFPMVSSLEDFYCINDRTIVNPYLFLSQTNLNSNEQC
ncbi:hypothetical protein HELRODRAFT_184409 [Helobdella robusta]|uniref:HTH psq-type domain-containing protein n=1 Tax=Helobdella robusta TaxID=6412 RepID=T1FL51_HELRO|nr:hypothetical protein HELRODRAFT_184409 [Helobdella robusta]ESN98205.1 hypothetical protein HELRODRAFT_184409 [Helobdella robusta]